MTVETEKETDGRWIAEVPDLPGVLVYSTTKSPAIAKAKAMALRVVADRLENGEEVPELSVSTCTGPTPGRLPPPWGWELKRETDSSL